MLIMMMLLEVCLYLTMCECDNNKMFVTVLEIKIILVKLLLLSCTYKLTSLA